MTSVRDFGFAIEHVETGKEMIRLAKLAEDLGYGTYWVPEDPFFRGPFTTMATIAAHTKHMRIGSQVINPIMRHPVSMAQEMSALDDYSEGRAVLGLGVGGKSWLDQLNCSVKRPLTTLRETIDIFQPLVRGDTVNHEGERFKASDVKLTIPPYRPKIPLYLGSLGPKCLQLCGEKCDGLLIALGASMAPHNISHFMDNLKIGVAKSGRDIKDLDITYMLTVSMSDNDRKARDHIKPVILTRQLYCLKNGHRAETALPDSFYQKLREYIDGAGDPLDLITDDIIDSQATAGCPERCKENIARLVEAGITSFTLADYSDYREGFSMDIESTMKEFQEKVMSEFL